MPEPTVRDLIGYDEYQVHVRVFFDGTNTIANVFNGTGDDDPVVATGVARRAKGDARDQTVGSTLAVSRAFAALADQVRERGVEVEE